MKNIPRFFVIGFSLFLFSGCGGDDPVPPPDTPVSPAIDVSGVWAGTWSGTDPVSGPVNGTWEGDITQTESEVNGAVILSGDIDCADGVLTGVMGATDLTGSLLRDPCRLNLWEATDVNMVARSMSGVWTQQVTGASGNFTGTQISTKGGPRIAFVNPSGGLPGTIVTIVGELFSPIQEDNIIDFNSTPIVDHLFLNNSTVRTRVPDGATTGPIFLLKSPDLAISPLPFNTNVTFPSSTVSKTIGTDPSPEGIVFRSDGRRIFVINTGNNNVSMINAVSGVFMNAAIFNTTSLRGIAISPDGRRVYVSAGSEIKVIDSNTNKILSMSTISLTVPGSGLAFPVPNALTISPDGRELYIIDTRDGGSVLIVDIQSKTIITNISLGMSALPIGISVNPDGKSIYVTDESDNTVKVIDILSALLVTPSISVGSTPGGIVFSPDGKRAYVANRGSNNVSVINTLTRNVDDIIGVPSGIGSIGIAISPDGKRLYVAQKTTGTTKGKVAVINTESTSSLNETIVVGVGTSGIVISPDGKRAFITNSLSDNINEIGGSQTLSVLKVGTGIGSVHSSPSGITCGTNCQASFNADTMVTLTANAGSTSNFTGWSGDCSASGKVTMSAKKSCKATFTVKPAIGGTSRPRNRNCFIATAAYGSYLEPHVQILRDFRDAYLITNKIGQTFVDLYYQYSPPVADIIASHESLRFTTRMALTPLILMIKYPLASAALILILFVGLIKTRYYMKTSINCRSSNP